jgi:hypothetical protein
MVVSHTNKINAKLGTFINVVGASTNYSGEVVKESNTLESENHPGWNRKGRSRYGRYDYGGPFDSIKKSTLRYNSVEVNVKHFTTPSNPEGYHGVFLNAHIPLEPSVTAFDLSQWGPIAYARMKPTKPSFNAVTELLELRDLSHLLHLKTADFVRKHPKRPPRPSELSKAWLAYQFGALPLLRSAISLYNAYHKWERRLQWLIDNEGKPIRRRVHLETYSNVTDRVVTTSAPYLLACEPGIPSRFSSSQQWYRSTWSEQTRLVWASAQFRYWLPRGPRDINWTNRMKRALFGAQLDVGQIYAAMPWTWLFDWFFNAHVVWDNMAHTVEERLVADYFYLMCTETSKNVSELSFTTKDSAWSSSQVVSTRNEVGFVRKRRVRGDPFGFNTNPNTLSGLQLSILGALGLSRLR